MFRCPNSAFNSSGTSPVLYKNRRPLLLTPLTSAHSVTLFQFGTLSQPASQLANVLIFRSLVTLMKTSPPGQPRTRTNLVSHRQTCQCPHLVALYDQGDGAPAHARRHRCWVHMLGRFSPPLSHPRRINCPTVRVTPAKQLEVSQSSRHPPHRCRIFMFGVPHHHVQGLSALPSARAA